MIEPSLTRDAIVLAIAFGLFGSVLFSIGRAFGHLRGWRDGHRAGRNEEECRTNARVLPRKAGRLSRRTRNRKVAE